jgi:hypothetical protein
MVRTASATAVALSSEWSPIGGGAAHRVASAIEFPTGSGAGNLPGPGVVELASCDYAARRFTALVLPRLSFSSS